ncbi:MAG: polysaccharide deacetylase family protein [Methanoregula sp.]|jgi:peptidoglycan/xylan/chitin deacetylase (PgdA/CDA1 family)|uniref:polysaccharide deacetylase family protein n=1 Tax=Methanoregula sp. TaxID=2052170 RepID=UPI003C15A67F
MIKPIIQSFYQRISQQKNRLGNIFQPRAVVLLYHRINEFRPDPQLICTSPAHFEQHLKIIQEYYHPISLAQLGEGIQNKDLPRNSVVITFDDGFADNLWNAAPLLEKFGIPATIFVTSGFIDQPAEMISDVLEHILLGMDTPLKTLEIQVNDKMIRWNLDDPSPRPATWNVQSGSDPNLRQRCYREIHRLMRSLQPEERQNILSQLFVWANCTEKYRPERRIMNSEELRNISRSGLIEIGAHTISHPMLAKQSSSLQQQEISGSREQLEKILGHRVTSFAYPYGGSDAVDARTIGYVKAAGFRIACDNVPGTVGYRTDLFGLPRSLVRDWDNKTFYKQLKYAFLK